MRVSMIVAHDLNQGIGRNGTLPWRLKGDLQHFKETTDGHPIIMGRVTAESIGRPLPNRPGYVLTRSPQATVSGMTPVPTLEAALAAAATHGTGEAFIIGGAGVYQDALPYVDRLVVTIVHAEVPGVDRQFPAYDVREWTLSGHSNHDPDPDNEFAYTILDLRRGSS